MEKRSDSVYFPHFFLCAVQWSRANDGARSLTEILFRVFFRLKSSEECFNMEKRSDSVYFLHLSSYVLSNGHVQTMKLEV